MKVTTKSRTYTTDGRVEAGKVIEVDDKAGQAMLKMGIVDAADQAPEPTAKKSKKSEL